MLVFKNVFIIFGLMISFNTFASISSKFSCNQVAYQNGNEEKLSSFERTFSLSVIDGMEDGKNKFLNIDSKIENIPVAKDTNPINFFKYAIKDKFEFSETQRVDYKVFDKFVLNILAKTNLLLDSRLLAANNKGYVIVKEENSMDLNNSFINYYLFYCEVSM